MSKGKGGGKGGAGKGGRRCAVCHYALRESQIQDADEYGNSYHRECAPPALVARQREALLGLAKGLAKGAEKGAGKGLQPRQDPVLIDAALRAVMRAADRAPCSRRCSQ